MTLSDEIVLATLPGSQDGQRVEIVLCPSDDGSRIELRQQSFAAGVGWFTQSSVALEPEQVAELRGVLGTTGARKPRSLPAAFRQAPAAGVSLRVYRAETA